VLNQEFGRKRYKKIMIFLTPMKKLRYLSRKMGRWSRFESWGNTFCNKFFAVS